MKYCFYFGHFIININVMGKKKQIIILRSKLKKKHAKLK